MNFQVALVGLGQMGLPIASQLTKEFDVIAFDISQDRRALAEPYDGLSTTDDLAQIASAPFVVLSLPNPAVSRSVLAELLPALGPNSLVIETSTVLPENVRESKRLIESTGARIIDAAILSGVGQMSDGKATLLVGGETADIAEATPILRVLGGAGFQRLGGLGAGMAAKVVNNGVAHAVMVVLVEAFALSQAEGIALEDIARMLNREDGGLQRPLNHRIMQRMASGDFEGGMPLDAARKDSTLALEMAQRSGTPLFAIQAAQTVYDIALGQGLARKDYSAIAALWEGWTGRGLSYGQQET